MLHLIGDVSLHFLGIRFADGEDAVPRLPMKIAVLRSLFLEPFGRLGLGLFDHVLDRKFARQQTQSMNVILDPADDQRGRIDVVSEDRRFVGVELPPNLFVLQPGATSLGAVDDMDENLGKRLRHDPRLRLSFCLRLRLLPWPNRRIGPRAARYLSLATAARQFQRGGLAELRSR